MTDENTNAENIMLKGEEFYKSKNYDLAIECFNKAIELDLNNAWAYAWKANSLFL